MFSKIRSSIDTIVFVIMIGVVLYVYFFVNRQWGIYIVIAMMILILLTYFPKIPSMLLYFQTFSFRKELTGFDFARESVLESRIDLPYEQLHKKLYLCGKYWQKGPLVFFVKSYYIFVSKKVVDLFLDKWEKTFKEDKNANVNMMIKWAVEKFPFEKRLEVESMIAKMRENDLISEISEELA